MQTKRTRNRARSAPVTLTQDRPGRLAAPPPPGSASAADPDDSDITPALDAHGFDPDAYDWVPVPRAHRVDGWTPERQRAFIGYLADTGSVRTAAIESGLSASSAYRLRRAPEGKAFAAAWDAAIQQAAHALVDAAFERAVHGSEEPVYDRDGRVVGRRYRQSDAMMMFLLRKHFPDRAAPAIAATAPRPGPVAETLARRGPVMPPDPAATVDEDLLPLLIARADNGRLPADLMPADDRALVPDAETEAMIEELRAAAAAAATPAGHRAKVDAAIRRGELLDRRGRTRDAGPDSV